MKISRRGLFRTAGAVVVAPALSLSQLTRDQYGSFWLAFYVNEGAHAGDYMVIHLNRSEDGPGDPAFIQKLPLEPAGGKAFKALFEIQPHLMRCIRNGFDRYRVYMTQGPGPIWYNHLASEGWIYVYGIGPDDWAVRTSSRRLSAEAFKEYQP